MSADRATRFESGGAVLECSIVPWDTEIFGFPVAEISRLDIVGGEADPTDVMVAFDGWRDSHDVRLISCRLHHLQLRESMALEEQGFRFIEMVYRPRFDGFQDIAPPAHEVTISQATSADIGAIEEIASTAFTTGRFLLDLRLPPELSDRRYASWVRSSFGSSKQTVLKAQVGGDLVGFFIVETRPDRSRYWHLTAVAPQWQGRGIGMSLWRSMLLRHRAEGASLVETTISGHNVGVINLYARLGFSFGSAHMTFHWLREPEARA